MIAAAASLPRTAGLAILLVAGALTAASAEPLTVEIVSADATFDRHVNQALVTFKMSSASAQKFADLTTKNVGRKMEVRVDGKAVMAPVIREPIVGGTGQISIPNMTDAAAKTLAHRIATGNAKVEFEITKD